MSEIRILAVAGSLRRDSANAALVRLAADLAGPGVTIERWQGLADVPPFDEDVEHDTPDAVAGLRAAIAGSDAVLVSTPEYNGSVPGQLKNALDWASRPYGESVLTGAPVAITSASPGGAGAAQAAEHLSTVIDRAGGTLVGHPFSLAHSYEAFTDDGRLAAPEQEAALVALLGRLADAARTARSASAA